MCLSRPLGRKKLLQGLFRFLIFEKKRQIFFEFLEIKKAQGVDFLIF